MGTNCDRNVNKWQRDRNRERLKNKKGGGGVKKVEVMKRGEGGMRNR